MKETEILRGLNKARMKMKMAKYSKGMVPEYSKGMVPEYSKGMLPEYAMGMVPEDEMEMMSGYAMGMVPEYAMGMVPSQRRMTMKMPSYSRGTPFVEGPGTGTSDSVPAMLSRGEAVLPAKTVKAMGSENIARMIEQTNGMPPKRGLRAGLGYVDGLVPDRFARGPKMRAQRDALDKANALGEQAQTKPDARAAQNEALSRANASNAGNAQRQAFDKANSYGDQARARAAQNEAFARANSGGAAPRAVPPTGSAPEIQFNTAETANPNPNPKPKQSLGRQVYNNAKNFVGLGDGTTAAAAEAAPAANKGILNNKALRFLGKAGLLAAPIGAIQAYNESDENVRKKADSVGFDYDTDGGRIATNTLNFLENTGNNLTFGLAGRLGRKIAGGSFFDEPEAAAPKTADTAPKAPATAGQTTTGKIASPVFTRTSPQEAKRLSDSVRRGTYDIPARGTGFVIANNERGLPAMVDPETGENSSSLGNGVPSATLIDTRGRGLSAASGYSGQSAPMDMSAGNTQAASQQAVAAPNPYDEVRDMLRASTFRPGDTWQQRADKVGLRRSAEQLNNSINNEQSQISNRYGTDASAAASRNQTLANLYNTDTDAATSRYATEATAAAARATNATNLVKLEREIEKEAGASVNDFLKSISVKDDKFSDQAYKENQLAFRAWIAGKNIPLSDVTAEVLTEYSNDRDAQMIQDEANSGLLQTAGRFLGLADPASRSRNPGSAAYTYPEIDRSGILGPQAISRDAAGNIINSARVSRFAGGSLGEAYNLDQLNRLNRQANER
jgi:hypothetical protein